MYADLHAWHDEFTAIRRHLHTHPELAFQENATAAYIEEKLRSFGITDIETGWAKTGIVATVHGKDGPASDKEHTIALRADMDALPIVEQTGAAHASTIPGVMHACGHDGHTATLLMAARYLATHKPFSGTIHFIFQPAEETGGGGGVMVEEGLFDKHPVKSVWGMHNWPRIPMGAALVRPGAMMASCDDMDITITGVGGHAAYPHKANDPVLAGAHLVIALQSIVSRNVEPTEEGVVSVTVFQSGQTHNVIESTAVLRGTFRSHNPEIRALLEKRIRDVCTGVAATFGVAIDINIYGGYPPTVNTADEAAIATQVLQSLLPHVVTDFKPAMGAEDFAFMLEKVPGCFIGIGTGKTDSDPHLHDPRYDFNDEILPIAASYWVRLAETLLPAK